MRPWPNKGFGADMLSPNGVLGTNTPRPNIGLGADVPSPNEGLGTVMPLPNLELGAEKDIISSRIMTFVRCLLNGVGF